MTACALLQVMSTVENFYLNQVAADLANGDFNLTDLVPNGISVSDPVFFNNGAVNVSSSNTVGLGSWGPCVTCSAHTSPLSAAWELPMLLGNTDVCAA